MSSLKDILESHPIKNLKAVIKDVKSDLAPKLALSKDKKKHSKAMLVDHILKLDKMGLIKKLPDMYVKPKRKPRTKSITTEAGVKVKFTEKAKKDGFKVDVKKAKKGKKTETVKFVAKNPPPAHTFKFEAQSVADSLAKPSKKSLNDQLNEMADFQGKGKNVPNPKALSAWNKYVKKMGGVKAASAAMGGYPDFKKSLEKK